MHGVYFLTDEVAIKIGFSTSAEHRRADLQTSHHQDLRLIAAFPGTKSDESYLHAHFRHLRIRGEWFRPAEELDAFIALLERGRVLLQSRLATITDAISGKFQELLRRGEVTRAFWEDRREYLKWFEAQKAQGFFGDPEFERLAIFCKMDLDAMCGGGRGAFREIPVIARSAAIHFAELEAIKSGRHAD